MSLEVGKGTTARLGGTVLGGQIQGWVLRLEGQGEDSDFLKTSEDASEIEILDEETGAFVVYLTLEDTAEARDIPVRLRAVDGAEHYLLLRELIQVIP